MKNFDLENVDCHAALAMTKNAQSGRSMIEMLGVLAIIGVLSVGGIAGYSKAMMKYRINKTIEQITLIAGNIRTFLANQGNYDGSRCVCYQNFCEGKNSSADGCQIIKKAKLVPDEMLSFDNEGKIIAMLHAFGGDFGILPTEEENSKSFFIYFNNIPDAACIEIISQNWNNANGYSIETDRTNHTDGTEIKSLDVPISIEDAIEYCTTDNGVVGAISFYFK